MDDVNNAVDPYILIMCMETKMYQVLVGDEISQDAGTPFSLAVQGLHFMDLRSVQYTVCVSFG